MLFIKLYTPHTSHHIYLFIWAFCLFYPMHVKTAEPIGSHILVKSHMTPKKGYGRPKVKTFSSNRFEYLTICENIKICEYNDKMINEVNARGNI